MKEVARPKEKSIVIKENNSTREELKMKVSISKNKGKVKLHDLDELMMGEGK